MSGEYETGRALIILCVQCSHGAVSGEYETGRALMNAGVIPSSDITPEAALTKLSYVLAKVKYKNLKNHDFINNFIISIF